MTGAINTTKEWVVDTEGSALEKLLALDVVDARRTFSNDVNEVVRVLGIEAGKTVLFHELKQVIFFDGTYIDPRHILSLVYTMTHLGFQVRMSRFGLNRLDTGPMLKLSFEETYEVVLNAALHHEKDDVKGPTPSVMMGQLAPMGTGLIECKPTPEYIESARQRIYAKAVSGKLVTTQLLERIQRPQNALTARLSSTLPAPDEDKSEDAIGDAMDVDGGQNKKRKRDEPVPTTQDTPQPTAKKPRGRKSKQDERPRRLFVGWAEGEWSPFV